MSKEMVTDKTTGRSNLQDRDKRRSVGAMTSVLAALCTVWSPCAPAQGPVHQVNKPPRPATADREYKFEQLSAPMPLPNVPPYTGRVKFLSGLRYPNDPGGVRIGMTFLVQEEQGQVLDWYREALKSYQWKMAEMPQRSMINASIKGGTLSVRVNKTRAPGFRSEVILSYQYK